MAGIETNKLGQISDAIAQLLNDGFRIINIQTPNVTYGYGPTTYVFVN